MIVTKYLHHIYIYLYISIYVCDMFVHSGLVINLCGVIPLSVRIFRRPYLAQRGATMWTSVQGFGCILSQKRGSKGWFCKSVVCCFLILSKKTMWHYLPRFVEHHRGQRHQPHRNRNQLQVTYSRKMNLETAFGFLLAVNFAACHMVGLAPTSHVWQPACGIKY